MDLKDQHRARLDAQNAKVRAKIESFRLAVSLLEVRRKHFSGLSQLHFFPLFLRAKYRLKAMDIENEILAKNHFIQIYSERLVNTEYAENVLTPKK